MNEEYKTVECLDYGKQDPPLMVRIKAYPPKERDSQVTWPVRIPRSKVPKFVNRDESLTKTEVKQRIAELRKELAKLERELC